MAYTSNRRVLLASRPQGAPSLANFRVEAAVPVPGEGQVLLRNLYLSLGPLHERQNERWPPLMRSYGKQMGF
ncbi:hypothetical protein [uncultured Mucilaginibacter sp.]|uniref:hypothetical protein n=1 Tax=uncultured Mucilaginibacter sp. TaxID=797541 RepID=UPI00344C1E90